MKKLLLVGWYLLFLAGCKNNTPGKPADIKAIALQPIGPSNDLKYIQSEVRIFFHKTVVVLPPVEMPAGALDTSKGERYSADTVLRHLAAKTDEQLPIIIGITGKDIYTTVRDNKGAVKQPAYKYAVWGIFGLGDCPGRASIASDFRLHTADTARYHHRLRTVVLHELGHNFGLPHCPNPHCIMNDANEKVATIDNSGNDYCRACRDKLGLP